jgi:phosphate-selective porin OprO and OprP
MQSTTRGTTVQTTIKGAALGALLLGLTSPALADQATTTGGLKVKTDDGRFEFGLGGRIHFDAYAFMNDEDALYGSGLTTATGSIPAQGGFAFRRTYLTLTGKAYGWKFKFENDFAAGASPGSYREMWISAPVHTDGELIIGQLKPRRGLEEITSSNDITMMERPNTSATGIYSGRQFLMGLGYKGTFADMFMAEADLRELGNAGTGPNEGWEYGWRVSFFPMTEEGNALHLGLSYSVDQEQSAANGSPASIPATAVTQYAGRRGPSLNLGQVGAVNPAGEGDAAQTTIGLEYGESFGPVTLQAEYAMATLERTHLTASGAAGDSDVSAWYLQASWFVTGERTVYKKDRAAFGKPKAPLGSAGAWELALRYEMTENGDETASTNPCTITGGVALPLAGTPPTTNPAVADSCTATTATLGVNWYVNPNIRYMFNYYMGSADLGSAAGKDTPSAISLRTQFVF